MAKRPTMTDVARTAGVSLKTVSRVVNREPGVSPQMSRIVLDAIDELAYEPNEMARGLRGGPSSTIGLVVTDIGNPFYSRLARTIEQSVGERLLVVASSAEDPEREKRLVRRFAQRYVDGLLIVPAGQDESYLGDLEDEDMPIVFLDRPPLQPLHDVVLLDSRWAAAEAVRQLVNLGARNIAMVGLASSTYFTGIRVTGYRDGLANAGLPYDESLVLVGSLDEHEARQALGARLAEPNPPDAVLAGNNVMALGAVRAIVEHGLTIPVAGFDRVQFSDILPMKFITVLNDPDAMGSAAASMLVDRIEGHVGPPRRVVLTPTIETLS